MTEKKGTVTGAELKPKNRGKRSNSKFQTPETPEPVTPELTENQKQDARISERIKQRFNQTVETVGNVANTVHSVSNGVKSVRRAVSGGNQLVTQESEAILDKAKELATKYNIELIDLGSELGSNPYQASGSLPQMEAKDANLQKLVIQKQNNALEVRLERRKQQRKIASSHSNFSSVLWAILSGVSVSPAYGICVVPQMTPTTTRVIHQPCLTPRLRVREKFRVEMCDLSLPQV